MGDTVEGMTVRTFKYGSIDRKSSIESGVLICHEEVSVSPLESV